VKAACALAGDTTGPVRPRRLALRDDETAEPPRPLDRVRHGAERDQAAAQPA
jgi:hypothetical protein